MLTSSIITAPTVRAEHAGAPDSYYPYGPSELGTQRTKALLYAYFTDELSEFNALSTGAIDHTDWLLTPDFLGTFCGGPGGTGTGNFKCSQSSGQYEAFGIQFNLIRNGALPNGATASGCDTTSTAGDSCLFWGINSNFGMAQTGQTINAGAEIRMAIAYLVDKQAYLTNDVALQGKAVRMDNNVPSGKTGTCNPSCSTFDPLNPAGSISAFNTANDAAQTPVVNSPDWQLALTHLARAFSVAKDSATKDTRTLVTDANADGVIDFHDIDQTGPTPGVPDGVVDAQFRPTTKIAFFIRSDTGARFRLGSTLANAIEAITGTTSIDRQFADIRQASKQIFSTATPDDWQMYTFGFGFPGPNWDYINPSYNSAFASNICVPSSVVRDLADNYEFHCDPSLDGTVSTGTCPVATSLTNVQFPPDATLTCSLASLNPMLQAVEGAQAADIPVYARSGQYAWSNSWAGMIETAGVGPEAPSTFLANYALTGTSDTLRWGQKQGTSSVNPWAGITTVWEFQLSQEYYDSLLGANPYNVAQLTNWAANSYRSFLSPTATQLGYTPPAGTAQTLRFALRNDVKWHDGVPFTANDVSFTMKECKRLGPFACFSAVSQVLDVTILGPFLVDIHMSAASPFHLFNLGGIYMLPRHIWDTLGTGQVDCPSAQTCKSKNTYDPIASLVYTSGTVINTVVTDRTGATTTLAPTTLRTDTYAAVGYGAYVCDSRDPTAVTASNPGGITAIGGAKAGSATQCSSSGSGSIPSGGSALLHAFDSDFATLEGSSANQYFRSTTKFKNWNLADANNDLVVSVVDISLGTAAFDCRATRNYITTIGTFTIARTCEKLNVAVSMTSQAAAGAGTWDFGDGTTLAVAGAGTITHSYTVAGNYVVKFTPTATGVTTTITGTGTGRVRIATWTVTSVFAGAPTETDWTYWDHFGTVGVVDTADIAVLTPQFRSAWVTEAGNTPPATPIGEWNQITATSGLGIVPFNQVYGLLPP